MKIAGFEVLHYSEGEPVNVLGLSGGKDSVAAALLMQERNTPNSFCCFNDTGNEHPLTYEYIAYLRTVLALPVFVTKADFSKQMAGKREYVIEKWRGKGVSEERIASATENLVPSGNPFLDLVKWKGRFPSTKARFCTAELKVFPFEQQVLMPLLRDGQEVVKWTGVRADESPSRAKLPESEYIDPGYTMYRPVLKWTADDCFAMTAKHGIRNNPLYGLGMSRVGCMPCIMSRKSEIKEISNRFPEVIDRLENWEIETSKCAKGGATFFHAGTLPPEPPGPDDDTRASIRKVEQWARTTRGGRQYDIFANEQPTCSSIYGLCE